MTPFRDTWLPLSLSDEALFYEILANIAHVMSTTHNMMTKYAEALKYHGKAILTVNRRLHDDSLATSDGTLSAVLAFAVFSVSIACHLYG